MSDLQSLKRKIQQEDKVVQLLDALGCQSIHEEQNGDLIVAQLPKQFDSDNTRSIQIRNTEGLSGRIQSRGISGDILSIVGYILFDAKDFDGVKENLYQIKAWVCNELGWPQFMKRGEQREEGTDWNGWIKSAKRKRSIQSDQETKENPVIPEETLNDYIPYGHWLFYNDGVNFRTQYEFEVRYDNRSERIVFPVRNREGKLIGVKGRYAGSDKHIMDEMKYLYVYPCDKSIELFGLHRALQYIKEKREVIVVEGAKTVMLLHQWGYKNAVSIEGNSLTPVQAMILRDLDVDIVFAWDKDVYTPKGEFDLEFIKRNIRQIKIRVMAVLIDTEGLLGEHDSPTERGKAVWHKLYTDCRMMMTGF